MKILITSGGTSEHIDDVRILSNISTGKLGARIAEAFMKHQYADEFGRTRDQHEILYLHGRGAEKPALRCSSQEVHSVSDLLEVMRDVIPRFDAVIHAMAVSDFSFRRDRALKCKSNDPQAFIDYMRDAITVNPKVISHIKEWNPEIFLVGFKFEVGLPHDELIRIASESMAKNRCDLMVANDKEEMTREGRHIAYIIDQAGSISKCSSKGEIAERLVERVQLSKPSESRR